MNRNYNSINGRVAERSNAPVLKTGGLETVPRVRIPPLPPIRKRASRKGAFFLRRKGESRAGFREGFEKVLPYFSELFLVENNSEKWETCTDRVTVDPFLFCLCLFGERFERRSL